MRLAPTYLARIFVAWPGGIAAAVRMLTWIPLWPASGCGSPLNGRPSMASCQSGVSFLDRPDVHGDEPRASWLPTFTWFFFHRLSYYYHVPAARHPSGHWPWIALVVSHPGRTRPLCLAWAAEIGLIDKRVPPPPLAAEGRLTLNT